MKILFTTLLIGLVAGLLGALCGVGGGIVMVPAFTLALGLDQKNAVATSLAVIVATAAVATINNARHSLIDWKIVGITAFAAMLAAWFGSDLMRSLSSDQLSKIFGLVLIAFGVNMLLR